MSGLLYKLYTNGRIFFRLDSMFTPTGQCVEPILPLYQLCQGHWWGYESHSAIVQVWVCFLCLVACLFSFTSSVFVFLTLMCMVFIDCLCFLQNNTAGLCARVRGGVWRVAEKHIPTQGQFRGHSFLMNTF